MDIRQLEAYVYTVKYRSFFTCCTEAVSVTADRQRAHLQSGKGAAHAAAQAHDKNALGDTGRSDAV